MIPVDDNEALPRTDQGQPHRLDHQPAEDGSNTTILHRLTTNLGGSSALEARTIEIQELDDMEQGIAARVSVIAHRSNPSANKERARLQRKLDECKRIRTTLNMDNECNAHR